MPSPLTERWRALSIDKSGPLPAYTQIASALEGLIVKARVPAGTALPPERVLCERFQVSRMTLRQAYDVLQQRGLIESHRGRGTFVAPARLRKQQQEMRSFTEEVAARGATPSSRLVAFRQLPPDGEDREFFGLPESETVYEIERVRLADGVPLAHELVHIPRYLCPHLERFHLAAQSLYAILEENYGLALTSCVEEISAVLPTRRQKTLLGLKGTAVALSVLRRTYTDHETPAELARTTYRGDLYRAIVRSTRKTK